MKTSQIVLIVVAVVIIIITTIVIVGFIAKRISRANRNKGGGGGSKQQKREEMKAGDVISIKNYEIACACGDLTTQDYDHVKGKSVISLARGASFTDKETDTIYICRYCK